MARKIGLDGVRVFAAVMVLVPAVAAGQTAGMWGRVSFTAIGSTAKDSGVERGFTELITTVTLATPVAETGGAEFGMDFRGAAYPGTEDRERRVSIYEGFVGYRLAGGRLGARVGQLWLNDLGALGSVGGVHVEYRQPMGTRKTRVRAGAFGGAEPKIMEAGYVTDVRKYGGYVALDGTGARRHVLGFVALRNQNLHERSVVTFSNFVPAGRSFFLYQAGEYDLEGPAGQGSGGLSYFFANARYSGIKRLELQGSYHRGRSLDARTITLDQLNGRPVTQQALAGLVFESVGGRVWVNLGRYYRVFAGYSQDRNNRDDEPTGRTTAGFFSSNLFGTGFDLSVSDIRTHRPDSNYDAWDVTVGRSITPKVYLSGGYSTALSVFRPVNAGGFVVENRPRTERFLGSGIVHLTRRVSLVLTGEWLEDGTLTELRGMSTLAYRF
jgi:hypothetical protein